MFIRDGTIVGGLDRAVQRRSTFFVNR